MNDRLLRFLNASASDRRRILTRRLRRIYSTRFLVKNSASRFAYEAHHPDSYMEFDQHPEFATLEKRFAANNRRNNGGDIPRLWSLILNTKQVISDDIKGEFAELGVWRGNTSAVLAWYAEKNNRRMYLFDTFEGFDARDTVGIDHEKSVAHFSDTSIELVKQTLGTSANACTFVVGRFPDSIRDDVREVNFAVVSVDCDLYEPMKAALDFFYPRMPKGGIFFLHDYSSGHWSGAKAAIDEFTRATGEQIVLMPDKSGSAFLRKALT